MPSGAAEGGSHASRFSVKAADRFRRYGGFVS